MKKILYFVIFILLFSLTFYYKEDILIYYNKYLSNTKQVPTSLEKNEYYRNYNFKYVANTDNFTPNTKQDILNIYYKLYNKELDTKEELITLVHDNKKRKITLLGLDDLNCLFIHKFC